MWLTTLTDERTDTIELQWGRKRPHPQGRYTIRKAPLLSEAKKIRDILETMANYRIPAGSVALKRLLNDLAGAGQRLYYLLLESPATVELRKWIEQCRANNDSTLTIVVHPSLDIPWGLVFEGAPRERGTDVADYEDFWCLKYDLEVQFSEASMFESAIKPENATLISLLDKATYDDLLHDFKPDYEAELEAGYGIPESSAFEIDQWYRLADAAAQKDALIYFFGHCRNGVLSFGARDIDSVDFGMMLSRLLARSSGDAPSPCHLIFLNACNSGRGEIDQSFRLAAAKSGVCGLISTEAKVPRNLAGSFGCKLLKALWTERIMLGEAMHRLRRDKEFWPVSLLYNCYAPVSYQIRQ